MTPNFVLDEASMLTMEARIPELAEAALRKAYYDALTVSGKVLEAIDGQLVETHADGHREVIRALRPPLVVHCGMKMTLRRSSR
ncbi:MAG: hypothetical protein RL260_3591 [Pseudomonadota bacterium]